MWRDDLGVSRKVIDIGYATKSLGKWYNPKRLHCASKMLQFVIRRIIDEEVPLALTKKVCMQHPKDEDVLAYHDASRLSQMFEMIMTRRQ